MSQVAERQNVVSCGEKQTFRLFDGDTLYYFRDLVELGKFVSTLGEAGVSSETVMLETVKMSEACWSRLPNIDASMI